MNKKIEVLPCVDGDPGYIRLVDRMGDDLSVVRAARVSYDAEWRTGHNEGADEKLIRYLIKNNHTSPFEHVTFTFEVKAPVSVLRQWHRHRTWSFNEMSGRYTEMNIGFYLPDEDELTTQAKHNKQMRTLEKHPEAAWGREVMRDACAYSWVAYKKLLDKGFARETARGVLPFHTYSKMFATIDLHNLFKFVQARDHDHAQKEIRVYAQAIYGIVDSIVPVCMRAYRELVLGEKPKPVVEGPFILASQITKNPPY